MQHLSLYARIVSQKASSENIYNVCESPVGIHNIVNAWFRRRCSTADVLLKHVIDMILFW